MRTSLLALGSFMAAALSAQVTFENVSTSSGLTYQGRSWGSSWGDINGDGYMDLYMSCHQHQYERFFENDTIQLLLNTGDGHFNGSIYSLDDGGQSDIHGGVFYDQDNDGDKDMFIVAGGVRNELFLRNDGGTQLQDIADELNLVFVNARGRQTTCVDVNNDGLTDLLINNQRVTDPPGQGSVLMLADPTSGYTLDHGLGFNDPESRISIISDLDGDGHTDICVVNGDSLKLYSLMQGGQFQQEARIDLSNITDVSIADFNGDLLPDLFVSRGLMHETDIQLFNDSAVHASINLAMGIPPAMFGFRTQGPIEVRVSTEKYAPYSVHVGSDSGFVDPGERRIFTLYPDQAQGFQDPSAFPGGVQCSVGFLPDSTWRIELAHTGTGKESVLLEINSGFPITGLQSTGMPQPDSAVRDLLLLNQGGFQFSASTSPAFMQDEYSANVTFGDLDNDMDIDIFVVTTGRAKNRKTHLYENMGNGDFQFHENGWGTKGDVAGIGDAVTTTDYDNDGFLDLFVTNGSTNSFLDSAGVDLYRNLGNGNNWIKLDLKGVQSNADGFGARVIVQANGVEQVRDRTGGIHLVSQDDARLHVGLGTADSVDLITVYWPSGVVDVLHDQGVNAILTIVEGEHAQTDCLGVPGGTANVGTFCNDSDPCTTGDRYDANCNCTGLFADSDADGICDALDLCPAGPDEALLLNINLDPFGSQTTWKLFSSDGVVHAGGPYADGDTLVADTICVPAGCYKFKVFDSNGDGLSAGGYLLTDGRGEHIIDANGAFSALSFARTEFCLPLGAPHLIEEDCDQVLTDGDALTSSTVAGATQYRFLFFDPHGSYKRSFFRANGILGSGGMATLPKNLELNVRVSATGPGWSTGYGPTCTITIIESGDYGIQKLATSDAGAGAERIEIWPNPNKEGLVHLSVDGLADDVETAQITVRDALGHLIRTQVLPVVEGGLTTLMDLQGIGAGVYLVQVTSGPVVCHRRLVMTQ